MNSKSIFVEGEFNGQSAVVILEKTPLTEDHVKGLLADTEQNGHSLVKDFVNDIYGSYCLYPSAALNGVKTTIIHPATNKHIDKYLPQKFHILEESYADYMKLTVPYIESSQFDIEWVYNILEHKKEADRIVFEDEDPDLGFILLPDLKWDQKQNTNLYLVAIIKKRDIKSLRDLTGDHLPLLENIRTKATEAICSKYAMDKSRLRIYFHYQPSYYHLHIHFTAMSFDAPGSQAERAHLLSNVISNLRVAPDYYQKATISFPAKEGTPLYKLFTSLD
jgi:m7GpppX diphosphatase